MLSGCGSSRKISRIDPKETVDLSGNWNDTDSRLVSEEIINGCLSTPWLTKFNIEKGKVPVVIVGTVVAICFGGLCFWLTGIPVLT